MGDFLIPQKILRFKYYLLSMIRVDNNKFVKANNQLYNINLYSYML